MDTAMVVMHIIWFPKKYGLSLSKNKLISYQKQLQEDQIFLVAKNTTMVATQAFKVSYKLTYIKNYQRWIYAITIAAIFFLVASNWHHLL